MGAWVLEGSDDGLHRVYLPREAPPVSPVDALPCALLDRAAVEFEEYFSGRRQNWTFPTRPLTGTEFQRRVWTLLSDIPFGATTTYGQLAARLGSPGAARAVGGANGANPLPVVVPCHRVVATSSLGGYSGGLDVKTFLLTLEGARS